MESMARDWHRTTFPRLGGRKQFIFVYLISYYIIIKTTDYPSEPSMVIDYHDRS